VTKTGTSSRWLPGTRRQDARFSSRMRGAKQMVDSKAKHDFRDRDRINRNEEYEVQYWAKELAVSKDRLIAAIEDVGPMVTDVKKALRR
jgi:hypothetical protein